jgi:hypothetical protein
MIRRRFGLGLGCKTYHRNTRKKYVESEFGVGKFIFTLAKQTGNKEKANSNV